MNQTAIPTPATTATGAPTIARLAVAIEAAPIATRLRGSGLCSGSRSILGLGLVGSHLVVSQHSDNTEVSKGWSIGVQEC